MLEFNVGVNEPVIRAGSEDDDTGMPISTASKVCDLLNAAITWNEAFYGGEPSTEQAKNEAEDVLSAAVRALHEPARCPECGSTQHAAAQCDNMG